MQVFEENLKVKFAVDAISTKCCVLLILEQVLVLLQRALKSVNVFLIQVLIIGFFALQLLELVLGLQLMPKESSEYSGWLKFSPAELQTLLNVKEKYGLNSEQTRLLLAIRLAENGKQGKEFGVLAPQAMRYENDPDSMKSFYTQAQWAAGTIKKRYDGNLEKFASKWAPVGASNDPDNLNKNWAKNVKYHMERF
jgi:hypothetical protein